VVAIPGAEGRGLAGVAPGFEGVAALPVWARAENVRVTAIARRTLRNLLFIGSIELLGTWFRE
jgi:hypothetical protein